MGPPLAAAGCARRTAGTGPLSKRRDRASAQKGGSDGIPRAGARRGVSDEGEGAAGGEPPALQQRAEPHPALGVKRGRRVQACNPNFVVAAITITIAARNGSSLVIRQKRCERLFRPSAKARRAPAR